MSNYLLNNDTIAALATPHGSGAIAVIRLSGNKAFSISETVFKSKQLKPKLLQLKNSHTAHFGVIVNQNNQIIDEVLITIFKAPNTYTGEDVIEISCHGSTYIQQQILQLLYAQGARPAQAGEFTLRAFLNGKFDLSQAEAVADLIASHSASSHQVAMQQMRGGFSHQIVLLRENLLNFASLIELELDFSEEDVEFANRKELNQLVQTILQSIRKLIHSFEIGNVIKNGVPVAIVGKPNAGKSTLLNMLLGDERAIVSEIPGTTRDTIEDQLIINGILFRFIDTAGIRNTTDVIEQIGVNKAFDVIKKSAIVIYLFDVASIEKNILQQDILKIKEHLKNAHLLVVGNKIDELSKDELLHKFSGIDNIIYISAKQNQHIDTLKNNLTQLFNTSTIQATETVVTNSRHVDSLLKAQQSLEKVIEGLKQNIQSDFLALDIRYALEALSEITGNVSSEDLLGNIFGKFCIGK